MLRLELADQLGRAFSDIRGAAGAPAKSDAERHVDRSAALCILGIQLRAVFGEVSHDVIGSLSGVVHRSLPLIARRIHIGAVRHQHLHGFEHLAISCVVVRKYALPASQARSEHQRGGAVLLREL